MACVSKGRRPQAPARPGHFVGSLWSQVVPGCSFASYRRAMALAGFDSAHPEWRPLRRIGGSGPCRMLRWGDGRRVATVGRACRIPFPGTAGSSLCSVVGCSRNGKAACPRGDLQGRSADGQSCDRIPRSRGGGVCARGNRPSGLRRRGRAAHPSVNGHGGSRRVRDRSSRMLPVARRVGSPRLRGLLRETLGRRAGRGGRSHAEIPGRDSPFAKSPRGPPR